MERNVLLRQLNALRDRYGYKENLGHHGDCEIYRARDVYGFACCTCGFIHDIGIFPYELIDILYPKYGEDHFGNDDIWDRNPDPQGVPYLEPKRHTREEMEEMWNKLVADLVKNGKMSVCEPEPLPEEVVKQRHEENLALLREVFGAEWTEQMNQKFIEEKNKNGEER